MGYRAIKATAGPAIHMMYQPWIRGEEHIPVEGPAILASNHLAVIDSFFLPLMIEREVAFSGKSDYFTGKGLKGWGVKPPWAPSRWTVAAVNIRWRRCKPVLTG